MDNNELKEKILRAKTASIFKLWTLLGLSGEPSTINNSPFREDKTPSFYIVPDGSYWKDLGRGDKGDCIDFVQKALQCGKGKAVDTILGYIDRGELDGEVVKKRDCPKPKPLLPQMSRGCKADLEALSKLRGIKISALEKAVEMGVLRFYEDNGRRLWCVTDSYSLCAQSRRLDGLPFVKGNKSKTLKGSWASHVIGLKQNGPSLVWLVEGGPDYLSAIQYAMDKNMDVRIGCILGAAQKISDRCLPYMTDSNVFIWVHSDKAGHNAFDRWEKQLRPYTTKIGKVHFPEGIKDFNELITSAHYLNEKQKTFTS